MTAREVRTVQVTCDVCGAAVRVEGRSLWPLPAHWHHSSRAGENSVDVCRACWPTWEQGPVPVSMAAARTWLEARHDRYGG